MAMSGMYGPADRAESLATIAAALDAGITLLDTADFYGMGHNEMLLAEALRNVPRDRLTISVKFGALRDPAGGWQGIDGRPAAVKNSLAYSLRRLNTEYIDVYRLARVDPAVPIEETIGAIGEMVRAGYVRHIGLSEAGVDTIARAHGAHPIVDVQIEYSLLSRGIESAILPACRERGIAITAYSILSRGLLSGHWSPGRSTGADDFRTHSPRFQGANLERNLQLVDALGVVAAAKGATVAQLATAWVLSRGSDIVPLVGSRTRPQLQEALAGANLVLDASDLARIEAAVPRGAAAGARYPDAQMANLDSER
jgi:aryl-alcohol dehydrogenase-like predicted oxidoreductase